MGRRPNTIDSPNKKVMFQVIGEYLKKQRERAGVTQQAVADKAGLTTAQYVSNIERGISPPSVDLLRILIPMYGMDKEQLAFFMSKAHHDFYLREFKDLIETKPKAMIIARKKKKKKEDL